MDDIKHTLGIHYKFEPDHEIFVSAICHNEKKNLEMENKSYNT